MFGVFRLQRMYIDARLMHSLRCFDIEDFRNCSDHEFPFHVTDDVSALPGFHKPSLETVVCSHL